MNNTFNQNFYIVTATIIPIFFLALTLQGSFYGNLQSKADEGVKALAKALEETMANREPSLKMMAPGYIALGVAFFAFLIVFAAFVGELFSLRALYYQNETDQAEAFVFWSTVGLILLTSAIPAWAMGGVFYRIMFISTKGLVISVSRSIKALRADQSKHSKNSLVIDKDSKLNDVPNDPPAQPPADLPPRK